jgi:hypothetical protein
MSDHSDAHPAAGASAAVPERRRNAALRELVDEMLVSIRTAANRELWTLEERQQYEAELALIMQRVRMEAVRREGGDQR